MNVSDLKELMECSRSDKDHEFEIINDLNSLPDSKYTYMIITVYDQPDVAEHVVFQVNNKKPSFVRLPANIIDSRTISSVSSFLNFIDKLEGEDV